MSLTRCAAIIPATFRCEPTCMRKGGSLLHHKESQRRLLDIHCFAGVKTGCCFWCCLWKINREPGANPGRPRHCDRGGLANEATDPAARDWEGGYPQEARVRRPARSRMREPSGEGESCWLFRTFRLVTSLPKSCFPFVSSRFSILNPEYSHSRIKRSHAPYRVCLCK
jgi:hypothetical protein